MNISFVWENGPPLSPSENHIEEGLLFTLDHFPDPRNLKSEKLIVRLTVDKSETAIDGIGYDQQGKSIFKLSCSLGTPKPIYSCHYYDDPR